MPSRLLPTGYYNKAAGAGQLLDYSTAAKQQPRGRDTDAGGRRRRMGTTDSWKYSWIARTAANIRLMPLPSTSAI